MIYLDNAATTQIDPVVLQEMLPYLAESFGNAGSIYSLGRDAKAAIEKARMQVAEFINARPEQIVFTSGGTEGNNMAFHLAKQYMDRKGMTHIVISNIEHKSVIRSAERLANSEPYYSLSYAKAISSGYASFESVKKVITKDTGFVSIMYTNNEIGISNPDLKEIAKLAHDNGALFHADCVQAASCHRIDIQSIDCDFATISSHKIHGPKGVGAIYIKDPEHFHPMIVGGNSQEFGLRGGTENVAGIVGFGMACELLSQYPKSIEKDLKMLRAAFMGALNEALKRNGIYHDIMLRGGGKVFTLTVDGVDAESLILALDNCDIYVSAGSACNSRDNMPSHVLKAMGFTDDAARSTIRISMSKMNDVPQVIEAANIIADNIAMLKGI